jgi:hypothetical protein
MPLLGLQVRSVRYIQSTLKKLLGLLSRSVTKKPLLTAAMKKKRLSFAKKYSSLDWEGLVGSNVFGWVHLQDHQPQAHKSLETIQHEPLQAATPSPPSSIPPPSWCGDASVARRGEEVFTSSPRTVQWTGNATESWMITWSLSWGYKSKFFLQDGAPCHKSKKVMDHLKEFKKEFDILDWPGNSPDLNPIENCWSHMKRKLKDDSNITSLPSLADRGDQAHVGHRHAPQLLPELSSSMPKRLKEVILQKEEMTKY